MLCNVFLKGFDKLKSDFVTGIFYDRIHVIFSLIHLHCFFALITCYQNYVTFDNIQIYFIAAYVFNAIGASCQNKIVSGIVFIAISNKQQVFIFVVSSFCILWQRRVYGLTSIVCLSLPSHAQYSWGILNITSDHYIFTNVISIILFIGTNVYYWLF